MSKNLGKLQRVLLGACERDDSSRSERSDERLRQWHCYQVAVTDTSSGDKLVHRASVVVKHKITHTYEYAARVKSALLIYVSLKWRYNA